MGKIHVVFINRKALFTVISIILILIIAVISFRIIGLYEIYINSYTRAVVIDPGHGGIDGGAAMGGLLEKDINLEIATRVKAYLEQMGYLVVLTRDKDISLDNLNNSSESRHLRDLIARVNIINNSHAQLFLSVHVNCFKTNLNADGSIIFYNERFKANKPLAYALQRALNDILINGEKRSVHDPQKNTEYYLLNKTRIPGVIIETAFISNKYEQQLLGEDSFKDEIAKAIVNGVKNHFSEIKNVSR